MDEGLTPKQLAQIKKRSRDLRIRRIRKSVALSAATIAMVFSGLIFARAEFTQLAKPVTYTASAAVPTATYDDGQATSTDAVPSTGYDESGSSEGSDGSGTYVPPTAVAPAPAPAPPPVTTSQS